MKLVYKWPINEKSEKRRNVFVCLGDIFPIIYKVYREFLMVYSHGPIGLQPSTDRFTNVNPVVHGC